MLKGEGGGCGGMKTFTFRRRQREHPVLKRPGKTILGDGRCSRCQVPLVAASGRRDWAVFVLGAPVRAAVQVGLAWVK